jgi:branched-subunit amino acid transport protein
MSTMTFWIAVAGAGAITFALRLSFIALLGRIEIPPLLSRALRFVPAAVFTAVVVPLLFYVDGAVELSFGNERLLAGLAAILIAWRTRSVPLTLVGGMSVLWTLQAIGVGL